MKENRSKKWNETKTNDSWSIFKIIGEFVEGYEKLSAIGPCISSNNYEVKKDFVKKFIKKNKKNTIFFKKIKNKSYFSLNKYLLDKESVFFNI